jgi:hypothetical protein
MTLIELVRAFCRRTNVPVPASVVSSTDTQILQIQAILDEELADLSARHAWQAISVESTFTSTAAEDQGALSTLAPNGFKYIRNETFWDRTSQLPVIGPLNAREWQNLKSSVTTNPRYQYMFRGNHILINPNPVAGHTFAFEYVSKNTILDTNGTTTKEFFTSDSDTLLLPDSIILQGLRWRWLREKGLDYGELFQTYEVQVKDAMGRDGGSPALMLGGRRERVSPGIFVPSGNWTP